ncbi:MAG TPA: hypothetical protein VJ992_15595 [Gemmatimonadales bacterium]|nr:hypothetical protein [Gemmatimonadales bacterium]
MRTPTVPTLRVPRTDRSYTRSVTGSLVVHGLLIAGLLWMISSDTPAGGAGPGPAGGGGGGGGARTTYVELPPYQASAARTAVPTPDAVSQPLVIPKPHVTTPPVEQRLELRELKPERIAEVSGAGEGTGGGAGSGTGTGGGQGGGTGTGTGNATGPGTGGGSGHIFPPTSRYVMLPPDNRPSSVRGKTVQVHFWIDARGNVERVAIDPEIRDRAFGKRFRDLLRSYKFFPATTPDGTHVAGELTVTFSL